MDLNGDGGSASIWPEGGSIWPDGEAIGPGGGGAG